MPKVNHIINSFNAGELSPKMGDRGDQEKYAFGCRTLENFVSLIYGGAERRPGLQYIAGQNSNSAKGRVVGFEHSVDDTYILLFENQVLRFFKSGAQVFIPFGTEDLSAIGSIVAHWKCDDNAANTTVVDADGATHDGVASANTDTLTTADAEGTANEAFSLDGTDYVTVTDHNDFSFGDGSNDSPFSIALWTNYLGNSGTLISKWDQAADLEWRLRIVSDNIRVELWDETETSGPIVTTRETLANGWHFIVMTYDGRGGSSAFDGINIYVDWVKQEPITRIISGSGYVAMENRTQDIIIGAEGSPITNEYEGSIDNVAVFSKELSAAEVSSLVGNDSTTAYEITTPYLTADLPTLKFEHSADVKFITHPDYEPRRLSRTADISWFLEAEDIQTGPFRDENTDTAKTITASATTGSVTLTALGHSPFVAGTTAGHLPSGSISTSKSQTGALYKLIHATGTPSIAGALDTGTLNNASATLDIPKGITWDLTTNGTWGTAANSASVVLERSYDSGTTYETVITVTSAANKNIVTSGTEDFADAIYRTRTSEAGGDNSTCSTQLSVRDTSHIGIVEITAVASGQSATATVLKTLGSTDKTHRWSEGSFSNFRGWPIDVTISAEERLTYVGSVTQPLTTWGSASGDFTDYSGGTDDDDAITFTLVGTGQQNRIRWVIPRDALIIGTVGGAHLLGASKVDEALTPTNVRARLQTTKGSEDVAAIMINQAILFAERGGKKIRELLFEFNSDSYKADDLTVFADHIMGEAKTDGVVDMAYQRTPDPILWCVRNDGQMAIMSYERDQKVFAWSRFVTVDGDDDSDFESVAVIYGGTRSEDEVWVTVRRTIGGSDVRYVERFKPLFET